MEYLAAIVALIVYLYLSERASYRYHLTQGKSK